jgi:predicted membrane-bound spermidine synthase
MSGPRSRLPVLVLLQATISASSLVVEIVAGRMLAPYVGMSLYTWTSVIAVVLAGFSAGHWWGGYVAERPARIALFQAGWVIMAAAVATGAAVVLLRLVAGTVMNFMSDPVWTIGLLTFSVFFLPSLFAGVPAPVLAHLAASRAAGGGGRALGAMFAAGALGAIGGTLLAGFVFIPWLGTAMTLAVITGAYLLAALTLFALASRRRLPVPPIIVAIIAVGLAAVSATRLSPCQIESQYYCIRIVDVSSDRDAPVRRMVLDHLSHGTSTRDAPRVMLTEFTAMIDAVARGRMEGRRFSAFFIGGGTYSVPRAWADRNTGPITVAEIDPAVTQAAVKEFWLDPSGIEIVHEDARRALLLRPAARYDVIVGDAFTDIAVPHHLITQEFFALVRSRLNEGGVFLMNVIDYPERLMALAAIEATLRTVFPRVEIWTEAARPQPGEQRVFVLAAGDRLTEFGAFTASMPDPKRFAAMSEEFSGQVLKKRAGVILTDDYAPIDRLLAPRL